MISNYYVCKIIPKFIIYYYGFWKKWFIKSFHKNMKGNNFYKESYYINVFNKFKKIFYNKFSLLYNKILLLVN